MLDRYARIMLAIIAAATVTIAVQGVISDSLRRDLIADTRYLTSKVTQTLDVRICDEHHCADLVPLGAPGQGPRRSDYGLRVTVDR